MAETSDYSGWVPAGTFLNYSPATAPPVPAASRPVVTDWESMTAITALVILYVVLANEFSLDPGLPPAQLLPTDSVPESGVAPHFGSGMFIGPGVRFYAC